MAGPDTYEVYAIRYATLASRRRNENFTFADPHDGPMPIDFYVWAIVGKARTFVVDMGINPDDADARARKLDRLPAEGLALVGVDARQVREVILTHMHWDHIGNPGQFPNARFHLQDREMAFATGRYMSHLPFRRTLSVETVCDLVRAVHDGRVAFHDGDAVLAPGLSLHRLGGHTPGMQVVRVHTRRGWVVLASDAMHFYANMEQENPFPVVVDIGAMMEGFRTLHALADSHRHIVPGHDPLVLARYPAAAPALEGAVARLDAEPGD